jgi:mycothiol synthase
MHPATFDIRPVTLRDDRLEAVVGIMPVLDRGPATVREYEGLLTTMRQTQHVVAWMNEEPVGFGFAGTWPGGETDPYLGALLGVEQTHRRQGIGSALFRSLAGHALDLGKSGFQFEVLEDRTDALAFLEHRSYTGVGRELQFELDLASTAAAIAEPPAGVEIVTRAEHPQLVRGMYEVAVEARADIPGIEGEAGAFDDWYAFEIERPSNLPEMCFLAVHRGDVIGSATLQVFEGDTVHHGGTLVRRAWRGRGIGRALTSRQIAAAKEAGFRHLHCETEARNEPMRRLLEELGYRSLPGVIELRGPLG